MPAITLPPPGVKFRLRNVASGRCIFNNNKSSKSDNFGAFAGPEHSDQLWTLIPGTGERQGWFQLQNADTGKCMFYNQARKADFHIHAAGDVPDQFWKLEPGVGALKRCFRLISCRTYRPWMTRHLVLGLGWWQGVSKSVPVIGAAGTAIALKLDHILRESGRSEILKMGTLYVKGLMNSENRSMSDLGAELIRPLDELPKRRSVRQ